MDAQKAKASLAMAAGSWLIDGEGLGAAVGRLRSYFCELSAGLLVVFLGLVLVGCEPAGPFDSENAGADLTRRAADVLESQSAVALTEAAFDEMVVAAISGVRDARASQNAARQDRAMGDLVGVLRTLVGRRIIDWSVKCGGVHGVMNGEGAATGEYYVDIRSRSWRMTGTLDGDAALQEELRDGALLCCRGRIQDFDVYGDGSFGIVLGSLSLKPLDSKVRQDISLAIEAVYESLMLLDAAARSYGVFGPRVEDWQIRRSGDTEWELRHKKSVEFWNQKMRRVACSELIDAVASGYGPGERYPDPEDPHCIEGALHRLEVFMKARMSVPSAARKLAERDLLRELVSKPAHVYFINAVSDLELRSYQEGERFGEQVASLDREIMTLGRSKAVRAQVLDRVEEIRIANDVDPGFDRALAILHLREERARLKAEVDALKIAADAIVDVCK